MPALTFAKALARTRLVVGLLSCTATFALCQGPTTPPPRPTSKKTCVVDSAPASDAEAALAREEYQKATDLFKAMADKDPAASKAGIIRTLLEQDEIADARALADAWLKAAPKDAAAQEILGEVLLRDGQIPEAYQAEAAAAAIDPCNARMLLTVGRIDGLMANFANRKMHFELAHKLAPNAIEIREAWIGTLPRSERFAELALFVQDARLMSAKEHEHLVALLANGSAPISGECTATNPFDSAKIPMKAILDGPTRLAGIALDISFNGKRRRMDIDTGASGLTLSRSAAARLGVTREQQVETGGIGDHGSVPTSIAHVDSVRIGDLEFHNCPVHILERASALDVDGLIGTDVFAKYLVTLDFPKGELRLDPLPARPDDAHPDNSAATASTQNADAPEPAAHNRYIAPEMKDWTPIFRSGHDLLIPANIGDAKERLFLVDTGATLMLISPSAARAVTKVSGESPYSISGISGEVKHVSTADRFNLIFARMKLPVNNMNAIDLTGISHDAGVEVSGLVAAPLLDLMTIHIDYRDNLMKFEFKPTR